MVILSGCATYSPLPLATRPDLARGLPLTVDAHALGWPQRSAYRFDTAHGLDMTEVAILAALNNPDLKAARQKAGVARAQVFAARLLPDPQLSGGLDYPMASGVGLSNAFNLGLSYGIRELILRDTNVAAARSGAHQVDLDVLWQEWQTVQQARLLYVKVLSGSRRLKLLQELHRLYAKRYAESSAALRQGNLTLDVVGTDLSALLDADTKLSQAERDLSQTRHDLDALLGLAPSVRLDLGPLPPPPARMGKAQYEAALAAVQQHRPDLLALQAGYQSQEDQVRGAVLGQFPSLSVGFNRARDTSAINSEGWAITLNLPLFDRNRGAIAVQRATRAQLRQEYQARLDQTAGEADRIRAEQVLIERQVRRLQAHLPELQRMVQKAGQAYEARSIDALTYLNMRNTLVSKQIELVDLEEALWKDRIALETLLGVAEGGRRKTEDREKPSAASREPPGVERGLSRGGLLLSGK
jgi:outer membrane protein TolC